MCSSFATSYRCQACGITKPSFTNDVAESILNLEVCQSVSTALIQRLSGSLVTRYWDECRSDQICVEMLSFINLPDILILRLWPDLTRYGCWPPCIKDPSRIKDVMYRMGRNPDAGSLLMICLVLVLFLLFLFLYIFSSFFSSFD